MNAKNLYWVLKIKSTSYITQVKPIRRSYRRRLTLSKESLTWNSKWKTYSMILMGESTCFSDNKRRSRKCQMIASRLISYFRVSRPLQQNFTHMTSRTTTKLWTRLLTISNLSTACKKSLTKKRKTLHATIKRCLNLCRDGRRAEMTKLMNLMPSGSNS